MQYLAGLQRIKEDENGWKKILIAGVVQLVPIFGALVVSGFYAWTLRRAFRKDHGLPDMDFDGNLLVEQAKLGLWIFLASFVYIAPFFLLSLVLAYVFTIVLLTWGTVVVSVLGWVVGLAFVAFVALVPAAVITRVALSGHIKAAFYFGEVLALATANIGRYLILMLVMIPVFIAASIGGILMLAIGLLFTMVLAQIIYMDCLGQAAAEQQQLGMSFELANDDTPTTAAASPDVFE